VLAPWKAGGSDFKRQKAVLSFPADGARREHGSPPQIVDILQIINMSILKFLFAGRGNASARIRIAADRRWP
jgi:hypothetical protein